LLRAFLVLQVYKGFAKEDVEERDAVICQRENPFYVDTVRAFRDRRYEYKRLGKKAKQDVEKAAAEKNELEKVKANDRLLLYDSLQLAHKVRRGSACRVSAVVSTPDCSSLTFALSCHSLPPHSVF
jgi:hypothetical protein